MSKQDQDRYMKACHAMQTGVKMEMELHMNDAHSPKHLRVGVNSAMVETSVLVKIMIDKGIITLDEWDKELADGMEAEVELYTKRISDAIGGKKVVLG